MLRLDDYSKTATGILGEKRETMLDNELLLRPQLGQTMRRGYTIPDGFTFGRPNAIKDGGTAEAMTGWTGSISLPMPRKQEKQRGRDFISLNRAALNAGLTNASDQYQFRATHDVRLKAQDEDRSRNRTRRIPPSMVFGISTRPSTPVFELLEHKYQDMWLEERRRSELTKREKEHTKKQTNNKIYETRASLLRTHQIPVDPAPLWQMPKFQAKALPHLQTFRTERKRRDAFDHHASDGISRKGVFGHGIYEPAKS